MKKKLLALLMTLFCYGALFSSSVTLGAERTSKDLVKDFYAWYIEELKDLRNTPVANDVMYEYVYACTVNKCRIDRKQGRVFSDYFLCTNDFDYEDFKKQLTVHEPVRISDDISLVPVSNGKLYIVVFTQKTKDGWRIIKVEDIFQSY